MELMTLLAITMYCVVAATLAINLLQVARETKLLKQKGQTPLTARNITTVVLAAVAEAMTVFLLVLLYTALNTPFNTWTAPGMFLSMYVMRQPAAYLVAWGLWSVFVRVDARKMKKDIEKDKEEALS